MDMNHKPTLGISLGQRPKSTAKRKPAARMRQAGQTMTEYAMLVAMVGILCVSVLKAIGTSTGGSFGSASKALDSSPSSHQSSGSDQRGGNHGGLVSYRPNTNSVFEARQ
jgi:Flp pilus assembly pilin Flp